MIVAVNKFVNSWTSHNWNWRWTADNMSHGLQGYSSQVTTHYSYFLTNFDFNMPSLSLSTAKHSVRRIFDKSLRNSTAKSAMNTSFCLSVTFLEREKKNCLLHEISYSRTSSKFTYFCEMWYDGAYSWVCRIAMFLYCFSYAFTKRKDEIVHVKKPSPNLDNKISSHGVIFFPCASLAQFCKSSPDIRQLEFTFFSAAIDKEVSPALRLAAILY